MARVEFVARQILQGLEGGLRGLQHRDLSVELDQPRQLFDPALQAEGSARGGQVRIPRLAHRQLSPPHQHKPSLASSRQPLGNQRSDSTETAPPPEDQAGWMSDDY